MPRPALGLHKQRFHWFVFAVGFFLCPNVTVRSKA
jgi:hypothetical protein